MTTNIEAAINENNNIQHSRFLALFYKKTKKNKNKIVDINDTFLKSLFKKFLCLSKFWINTFS